MRVAVFLDVDNTLTEDFIQKQYATSLKCQSEYCALETQYGNKTINSKTFGEKIIALFASKGFTEEEAASHYQDIVLKPGAEELLKLTTVDKYLVSNGPSYYIDALAARHNIPEENRCRSIYKFNRKTGLIDSCLAVDDQDKADFVSKFKGKYDITIGVGDSAEFDGPFLSHCTIRLLTVETGKYLYIPHLTSLVQLIGKLTEIGQAELSDERLVDLVNKRCERNPKLARNLRGGDLSKDLDDDKFLALVKQKCEQNPKLIQDVQSVYPSYQVLPVALMAIALVTVTLLALSFAHHIAIAAPAIFAILSLVGGGLLLISYWKPAGRKAAFWWVASLCYLAQMALAFVIFRDVFFDKQNQWGYHELFWGVIVTILVLLATPALAEPAKRLSDRVTTSGARQETV